MVLVSPTPLKVIGPGISILVLGPNVSIAWFLQTKSPQPLSKTDCTPFCLGLFFVTCKLHFPFVHRD